MHGVQYLLVVVESACISETFVGVLPIFTCSCLPNTYVIDMWDVFKRVCVRVYAHFHCWRAYHQQFHYQYPIIPSQSWELVRDGYWVILWKELLVASSAVAKLEAGSGYKRYTPLYSVL